MTAGLPYLRNLRKTDLIELAQVSRLRNYEDLMKKDLETVLDKHLWSNRTKLASEGQLADYYRRLTTATPGKTPAKTPTKRTPLRVKSESTTAESSEASSSSAPPSPAPVIRTLKRTPSKAREAASKIARSASQKIEIPGKSISSPRIHETLDNLTDRTRSVLESLVEWFESCSCFSRVQGLRERLGDVWTFQGALLLIEFTGLLVNIVPIRPWFDLPSLNLWLLRSNPRRLYFLDPWWLFKLPWWAPFILWFTAGFTLPLITAYFFNLPLRHQAAHTSQAQKARRAKLDGEILSVDPLMFALARGLLLYHVLGENTNPVVSKILGEWWNIGSRDILIRNLPGGLNWVLIRSGVGVIVSLYDAILRKSGRDMKGASEKVMA